MTAAPLVVQRTTAPLPHHVLTQGVGHQVPVLGVDPAEVAILQFLQLVPRGLVECCLFHQEFPLNAHDSATVLTGATSTVGMMCPRKVSA